MRRGGGDEEGAVADADPESSTRTFARAATPSAAPPFLLCGDWHRADDHVQAAFVALHRHWRRVRDRGALDAWMRRTLVRSIVDESQRPWRREHATAAPEVAAAVVGPADGVAARHVIVDGLRAVPARQRAVLVLQFLEDPERSPRPSRRGAPSWCRRGPNGAGEPAPFADRLGAVVAHLAPRL
jgi:hypothetical protein